MQNKAFLFRRYPEAFTLIELLVVTSIIGVLTGGILLPAIQNARETARRCQCTSQLRQLGQATQQYLAVNSHFPPGQYGPPLFQPLPPDGKYTGSGVGTIPFILPYIEQKNLGHQIQTNLNADPYAPLWLTIPELMNIGPTALPILVCPSDATDAFNIPSIVELQAAIYNKKWQLRAAISNDTMLKGERLGRTSYIGVSGDHGEVNDLTADRWRGIFLNRTIIRTVEVIDGLSHTLLFGECCSQVNRVRQYNLSWFCGPMPTCAGLDGKTWHQFSSNHMGIVDFVFADGSVHGISVEISPKSLRALSGIADHEVVSTDAY